MDNWDKAIEEIKAGLEKSIYKNETMVSQMIVRRLIELLGWDIYNPTTVYPEYNCGQNGRVDYALLNDSGRPLALIEVKALGLIEDNVIEQLIKYAFGTGVPIIILTDGKEWHFFYAAAGNVPMQERRFYKIDISDRNSKDIYNEMSKYLGHDAVLQGKAATAAEETYRSVSIKKKAKANLAPALKQLIETEDEELYKVISEKVADLSGVAPDKDVVFSFLKNLTPKPIEQKVMQPDQPTARPTSTPIYNNYSHKSSRSSFKMLNIPTGTILTAVFNPNLKFQTMDEQNNIKDLSDGTIMPISRMASKYLGGSKNGYEYFALNGKKLSDIRMEFDSKYLGR